MTTTTTRNVVSRDEWLAARAALLEREKTHTRLGDELARQRRELPWLAVEKPYTLRTADGPKSLTELFAGRSQLLVYHFMFGPSYEAGCSSDLTQTREAIEPMLEQLPPVAFRNARAAGTDIYGYLTELFGFTAFALEDGAVFQTYATTGRGVEFLMPYYGFLDRAPNGRDEAERWQLWIRRHDEYDGGLRRKRGERR
jgi:predicted dithiol-disulfide oxidoreductase (DUF899 family)